MALDTDFWTTSFKGMEAAIAILALGLAIVKHIAQAHGRSDQIGK